jgi:hypothetical protein
MCAIAVNKKEAGFVVSGPASIVDIFAKDTDPVVRVAGRYIALKPGWWHVEYESGFILVYGKNMDRLVVFPL